VLLAARAFAEWDRGFVRAGSRWRCGSLVEIKAHAVGECELVLRGGRIEITFADEKMRGATLRDPPDLRCDAENVGRVARERRQRRVAWQAGADRFPHILAKPIHGQSLRRECEWHARLVESRGATDFQLPQSLAILADAHGELRFSVAGSREIQA